MKRNKLLVIADDLTGANDTGVMFAESGINTVLVTNPKEFEFIDISESDVFSVSTDSRAIGFKAEDETRDTILKAIKKGINQLYLKIDSTMRGSVKYQVKGALSAWENLYPGAKAIICPAYPDMGRSIENDILYVNGIPVSETPSGKDLICPVVSSDMKDLLPEAICLNCSNVEELVKEIKISPYRQIIINAKSELDLEIIAKSIELLGSHIIPVGSAGLAKKINIETTKSLSGNKKVELGRVLILVTSIHETSQNQVDFYISNEGGESIVFNPLLSQLVNYEISKNSLKKQVNSLIKDNHTNLVIKANPSKINTKVSSNINDISRSIAKCLSELALNALENGKFDSLILFGGDGALALLSKMGVSDMFISHAVSAGVPLCYVCKGPYKGLKVITKSGGFGNISLLSDIL